MPAMGSLVTIKLSCAGEQQCETAFVAARDILESLEDKMTLYRPSELTRVNDAAGQGPRNVSEDTYLVAAAALRIAHESGGYFDPTITPALDAYNLYHRHDGETVPDIPESAFSSIAKLVDFRKVVLSKEPHTIALGSAGMKLDFGAIAKGYALDRISMRLFSQGVSSFSLNFGGHLLVKNMEHESIVEHPQTGKPVLRCRMSAGSLSASAQNRRFVVHGKKKTGHIVNPRSLAEHAGEERISLVYHASATEADAWSTALFFPPQSEFQRLCNERGIHALRLESGGQWLHSAAAKSRPVCVSTNP